MYNRVEHFQSENSLYFNTKEIFGSRVVHFLTEKEYLLTF